jgi:hypothetical protein
MNADDFLQGQRDCMNGVPHKAGMPVDYDRGYNTQYDKEQRDSERTKNESK